MINSKENWIDLGFKIDLFQQTDKFTDVELIVEDKIFRAHKVVLASASPYFETMFSTEMCEKNKKSIEIHGIKYRIFEILIRYIYKCQIELDDDNVQEILDGSNMLQLLKLTDACFEWLKNKMSKNNVLTIYCLADLYSGNESSYQLKRLCKFFIETNFLEIIECQEFLHLPYHLLETLLKSESLIIYDELDVFKITIKWILNDSKTRLKHVFNLMKYIRLPIIPEEKKKIIIERIKNKELQSILEKLLVQDHRKNDLVFHNNDNYITDIDKLKNDQSDYLSDSNKLQVITNINLRRTPRIKNSCIFYLIGGIYKKSIFSDIFRINFFDFKLSKINDLSVSRYRHQAVQMNGLIYLAGGISEKSLLKLVQVFDPYENKFIKKSFMKYKRQGFGLIALKGDLYAIGGSRDHPSVIEKYENNLNTWVEYDFINELPFTGFKTCQYKNDIYIIGGINKNGDLLDQTLCYNPKTKSLKVLSSMNQPRAFFGIDVFHDDIYVVGGQNNKTAERYSIIQNRWTYISKLDQPLEDFCLTNAFNKLLLIGGVDSVTERYSNNIYSYNPAKNKWKYLTNLRFGFRGASMLKFESFS